MIDDILVVDDFLANPEEYRASLREHEFRTYEFPEATFHGIALMPIDGLVANRLVRFLGDFVPTMSFLRKSPLGQVEPHFIHTDVDVGMVSTILFLNEDPPSEDGTSFWRHDASGEIGNKSPHLRSDEGKSAEGWTMRRAVWSRFNRLLIFPSYFFHSRSIPQNWGSGDAARLTQVTFGVYQ